MIVNDDEIEKLNIDKEKFGSDYWLSTNLIDFLIKYGIPLFKSEEILVPTCNIEGLLDMYNSKAKSDSDNDKKFVKFAREKYKNYGTKPFQIFQVSCQEGHFFVLEMVFDATDVEGNFFQWVKVYDSLKRSGRNKKRVIQLDNTTVRNLLKKYQEFFIKNILYGTDHKEVLNDPEYILQDLSYHECPIQENSYDCALFAYGILIHLVRGIKIKNNIFTQSEVTYFRKSLYLIFNAHPSELSGVDPKKWISAEFITSFFPKTYSSSNNPNIFWIICNDSNRRIIHFVKHRKKLKMKDIMFKS